MREVKRRYKYEQWFHLEIHSQMELKPWSSSSLSAPLLLVLLLAVINGEALSASGSERPVLRLSGKRGEFKILQIADMHYTDGRKTKCLDVLPEEAPNCSDLNTTAFVYRVVKAENPTSSSSRLEDDDEKESQHFAEVLAKDNILRISPHNGNEKIGVFTT